MGGWLVIGPAGLASCLPMAVVPGIHRWRRDLADRYDDRLHGRLVVTGAGHAGWCCQSGRSALAPNGSVEAS